MHNVLASTRRYICQIRQRNVHLSAFYLFCNHDSGGIVDTYIVVFL